MTHVQPEQQCYTTPHQQSAAEQCACRDPVIPQKRIVKNVSARLFGDRQVVTGRRCQGAPLFPCADVTTPRLMLCCPRWSSGLLCRTCCVRVDRKLRRSAGRCSATLWRPSGTCCVVFCCVALRWLLLSFSPPPPGIKWLFVLPQRCLSLPSPPPAPPPPVLPHSPSPLLLGDERMFL